MTIRYFYRNPLEAAYMIQKYGIECYCIDADEAEYGFLEGIVAYDMICLWKDIIDNANEWGADGSKIYIHPNSHHILEPQDGDIGVDDEGLPGRFEDGKFRTDEGLDLGECKIILRGGLQFFAPEKEEK